MDAHADMPTSVENCDRDAVSSAGPFVLSPPRIAVRLHRPGLIASFVGLLILGYVFLVCLGAVLGGDWSMLFGLWEMSVCCIIGCRAFAESVASLTLYANGFSAKCGCRFIRHRWADISLVWAFPRFRFAEPDGTCLAICGPKGVFLFDMSNADASLALERIKGACDIERAFKANELGVSVYSRRLAPDVEETLVASCDWVNRAIYRHVFSVFVLYVPAMCGAIWYAYACGEPTMVVFATIATLYALWRGIDWCRLCSEVKAIGAAMPSPRHQANYSSCRWTRK
jgi:hypothetical protein